MPHLKITKNINLKAIGHVFSDFVDLYLLTLISSLFSIKKTNWFAFFNIGNKFNTSLTEGV